MTLTCPGSTCPLCTRAACTVCGPGVDMGACYHTPEQRHSRVEPLVARTATERISERLEVELGDGDAVEQAARYMEACARLLRKFGAHGGVISITVEGRRS